MGGRSHDMCIFHRVAQEAGSDKSCSVRHVDPEDSTHLVGDLAHSCIVPLAGISGSTTDDELRLVLESCLLHLFVIDHTCRLLESVCYSLVEDS